MTKKFTTSILSLSLLLSVNISVLANQGLEPTSQDPAEFTITNQWQGGFQGGFSTTMPYTNFVLSFTYSTDYTVNSSWPNSFTKTCSATSCTYQITGNNYNKPLSPGDIGITVNTTKAAAAPTNISVTPPPPPSFPIPTQYKTQPYRGVNLAGGDFNGTAPAWPYITDALYFVDKGMNTVRLPFRWEYLEPNNDPSQIIDFTKAGTPAKALADLVKTYTDAGLYVILDMHNYMRYQTLPINGNDGPIIGKDAQATTADYARAWSEIASAFKNNNHVIFDLMNEPHDMDTQLVFNNYKAAIAAIRQTGANNLILLEGNYWSGLHAWATNDNATVFTKAALDSIDPAKNYAINVHQYFDTDFSGTQNCVADSDQNALRSRINYDAFIINYVQKNDVPVIVTEMGGTNTQACANDINYFLGLIKGETRVTFLGWTGWAAGQAWGGGYNYYLGPDATGNETLPMTKGFEQYLIPPPKLSH